MGTYPVCSGPEGIGFDGANIWVACGSVNIVNATNWQLAPAASAHAVRTCTARVAVNAPVRSTGRMIHRAFAAAPNGAVY